MWRTDEDEQPLRDQFTDVAIQSMPAALNPNTGKRVKNQGWVLDGDGSGEAPEEVAEAKKAAKAKADAAAKAEAAAKARTSTKAK